MNYVKIYNLPIKKKYLKTFEDILNYVILDNGNNENNSILGKYRTEHYIYLLGVIVDERNKNKTDNFLSVLDDTDEILKDFDIEEFFKKKRKKKKYFIDPSPDDPLRNDLNL